MPPADQRQARPCPSCARPTMNRSRIGLPLPGGVLARTTGGLCGRCLSHAAKGWSLPPGAVTTCAGCARPTMRRKPGVPLPPGMSARGAHGLCNACYLARRKQAADRQARPRPPAARPPAAPTRPALPST